MKSITRKEELVMLSILNLGENAHLIAIQDYLSRVSSKKISLTSAHLPLSRLEKKGYIASKLGKAMAVRGGGRKAQHAANPFLIIRTRGVICAIQRLGGYDP